MKMNSLKHPLVPRESLSSPTGLRFRAKIGLWFILLLLVAEIVLLVTRTLYPGFGFALISGTIALAFWYGRDVTIVDEHGVVVFRFHGLVRHTIAWEDVAQFRPVPMHAGWFLLNAKNRRLHDYAKDELLPAVLKHRPQAIELDDQAVERYLAHRPPFAKTAGWNFTLGVLGIIGILSETRYHWSVRVLAPPIIAYCLVSIPTWVSALPTGLTVRKLWGSRNYAWEQILGLQIINRESTLVLTDNRRISLGNLWGHDERIREVLQAMQDQGKLFNSGPETMDLFDDFRRR